MPHAAGNFSVPVFFPVPRTRSWVRCLSTHAVGRKPAGTQQQRRQPPCVSVFLPPIAGDLAGALRGGLLRHRLTAWAGAFEFPARCPAAASKRHDPEAQVRVDDATRLPLAVRHAAVPFSAEGSWLAFKLEPQASGIRGHPPPVLSQQHPMSTAHWQVSLSQWASDSECAGGVHSAAWQAPGPANLRCLPVPPPFSLLSLQAWEPRQLEVTWCQWTSHQAPFRAEWSCVVPR